MMTVQNISYWVEDGKFTIDGYDFYDTLEEMELDIDRQRTELFGEQVEDRKEQVCKNNAEQMERFIEWCRQNGYKNPFSKVICMDMGEDNDNCDICPLRDVCGTEEEEELAKRLIESGEFQVD